MNLCPFAKAPFSKGQVRFVVSPARDAQSLLSDLVDELSHLARTDARRTETTLLIHPHVLHDFDAYNDFLDPADAALQQLELDGVLQIASFHPDYRFAGAPADDPANATNRSPHPMLHLLREASLTRAVEAIPDPSVIFEANMRTLRALGAEGIEALNAQCRADARTPVHPES
jgi:hypothetical protein